MLISRNTPSRKGSIRSAVCGRKEADHFNNNGVVRNALFPISILSTSEVEEDRIYFVDMGYAVVERDDNRASRHCAELTLALVHCNDQ